MSKEVWLPIQGYEGYYAVSNLGNVWSVRRNRNLCVKIGNTGYCRVTLSVNGRCKTYAVHRLVAEAFIPNCENKPTVNHVNECKTDNRAENLEWATHREQNLHGTRTQRVVANTDWKNRTAKIDYAEIARKHNYYEINRAQMKPVLQFDKHGFFIARHDGVSAAARAVNRNAGSICECAQGRRKSCGGYQWKYETPTDATIAV